MSSSNHIFKIIMGGDGGVGKTTMLHKYVKGIFIESLQMTIGLDFFLKKMSIDSKNFTLQIWDFSGQERFRFLHESYVNGADVGVLLFDLTRMFSLKNIPYWTNVLRSMDNNLPLILVGTKYDLITEKNYAEVDEAQVFEIAEMCNIRKEYYLRTSAKTGFNINKVFNLVVELATDHINKKNLIFSSIPSSTKS
ncbi:MAG: Rab family GTPase [Promethearchaeota archaeon]